MVFQRPNPFPTMSIYDNVLAGNRLNAKKLKKSEADDDRRALAEAAPTSGTRSRTGSSKPGMGLSGGQQQRLCIARAIAVEPEVLLMDEPCSALDPISTSAIEDLIHELKSDYTIVIVTHNMQQAARVSDDTGFFNLKATGQPGHLVEFNPTKKMFSNPDEAVHRGLHLRPLRLSRAVDGRERSAADEPGRAGVDSRHAVTAGRGDAKQRGGGPAAGKVSTQATDDRAGHAPADRRDAAGGAGAHDRRGDDVGRRDRGLEDERRGVEHRGADGLGGERVGWVEVDDLAAQGAHDPPATGVGAQRDRAGRRPRSPTGAGPRCRGRGGRW